jgi:Family of unknown function (DUF6311)
MTISWLKFKMSAFFKPLSSQSDAKSPRELTSICLILGIALLFFFIKFDINALDVTHTNWIYHLSFDPQTEIISWHYYRHTPWSFPVIGRLEGYDYPTVTGSAMTGIVSPLAVFFKLFSNWLPDEFQYFGWWFLLSYLLQGYFGLKLLKNTMGSGQWTVDSGQNGGTGFNLKFYPPQSRLSRDFTIVQYFGLISTNLKVFSIKNNNNGQSKINRCTQHTP